MIKHPMTEDDLNFLVKWVNNPNDYEQKRAFRLIIRLRALALSVADKVTVK